MHALVIDDSRTMRRIVGSVLQQCGLRPVEAGHGEEALAELDRLATAGTPPVLATVDWNMPVMDGLTFVTRVRQSGAWPDLTLMMVTTESEHGQIVRALAAGAHEYVIKPFTTEDMVSKLELLGLVRHGAAAGQEVPA
jgi:two-component system chemotaxis response regulator CheY